jgi:ubiquinone/menaquinone biosynthesis C-methylase UbiE
VPDAAFAEPRLAQIYDPMDPDRRDLDVYAAMAEEFGARSVLDVGCGTGTLACLLAARAGGNRGRSGRRVPRSRPSQAGR